MSELGWRARCPTDDRGWVWLSYRSDGQGLPDDGFGHWADPEELVKDSALFMDDYAAWFRKHNNGAEPTESAWITRRIFNEAAT